MINKRLSAIALSALLAFSPAVSLAYAAPAYAEENADTGITDTVNEDESGGNVLTDPDELDDDQDIDDPQGNENDDDDIIQQDDNGGDDDIIQQDDNGDDDDIIQQDDNDLSDPETPETEDEGDDSGETEDPCVINGHSWDEGVVETEAGCVSEGLIVFTCTECGETRSESVPAKGHSFGEWTIVKQATTRVDGEKERTCASCGETETETIPHTILKVKTITLSKSSVSVLKGKTYQLKATVSPSDATSVAVAWKSGNTSVATVSSTGLITAKGNGTATITCTAKDGRKTVCKVTVKQPVTKITLNKTSLSIMKGKTYTLKATATPSSANNKTVSWKSSNTKVATVSSAGKVTAKAKGTATITCTAKDGSGVKAVCKVTVKQPVTKITLNKTSLSILKGNTYTLKATVGPSSASQ